MVRQHACLLGLTGNIACGKTTVARMLEELGAEVIDADLVAHDMMLPGSTIIKKIEERFGPEMLRPDGSLDRRALGAIVFNDPRALVDLEQITHPPTIEEILRRARIANASVVVVDAIKLFESGLAAYCLESWTVYCEPEEQVERLMSRSGLSRDEARTRINAQPPQDEKRLRADRIIDNSGGESESLAQVQRAWNEFIRRCGER